MIDRELEEAAERMYLYMRSMEVRLRELEMTVKTCRVMLDHLTGGVIAEKEARTASMMKLITNLTLNEPKGDDCIT